MNIVHLCSLLGFFIQYIIDIELLSVESPFYGIVYIIEL